MPPDSNSPSSLDAPMNRLDTAETRPRMASGVTICTRRLAHEDRDHIGRSQNRKRRDAKHHRARQSYPGEQKNSAALSIAISCGKSEIELSLADEQSRPSALASTTGDRCDSDGSHAKNFSTKIPRNPLISLDSDERIQGNPRKSNPQKQGFSQRNGDSPRKSKRIDRTKLATRRPAQRSPALVSWQT